MEIIRDRPRSVELEAVLRRPLLAHLATASEHGPRCSPVWFLWEEGAFWIIADPATDTFPERLRKDPRCALSIVDSDVSTGRHHHVGVRGRADVGPFEPERGRRLLERYLGESEEVWDPMFRELVGRPSDFLFVRVDPDTVVVRDQSYRVP